jgi:hypothetical protein
MSGKYNPYIREGYKLMSGKYITPISGKDIYLISGKDLTLIRKRNIPNIQEGYKPLYPGRI